MCDLCQNYGFIITLCRTCKIPMIVSKEHKNEFSGEDMVQIRKLFPHNQIRWEQIKIKDHAHAHIID